MKRGLFLRKILGLAAAPAVAKVIDPIPEPFPEALKEVEQPKRSMSVSVYSSHRPNKKFKGYNIYG